MSGPHIAVLLFEHPSRKIARRDLRMFLRRTAEQVVGRRQVNCLITGDAQLRALNREFRGKDSPTDVLSFPAAEGGGEIAISLDTAVRQAAELGHCAEQELRILILHALLHLAGMDHETDSGEMRRAEARWRRRLGLVKGLIERAPREARRTNQRRTIQKRAGRPKDNRT